MPLSCAGGVVPEERLGGRVRAGLPVLPHLRGGRFAPLRAAESGQHLRGVAVVRGWMEIQKQGCGKPNRIYPKS